LEAKKRGILEQVSPLVNDLITIASFRIAPSLQAHVPSRWQEKNTITLNSRTIDKDFGERAILRGEKHYGIIRLVNIPLLR
jgi:hypothetical protein